MTLMTRDRLRAIAGHFRGLSVAVVGDFRLDRFLEIDPAREERSIETGLAVHNVVGARAVLGAAGAIVANLSAMGVGRIIPIGFAGDDTEGHRMRLLLRRCDGVRLRHFLHTPVRRTCASVRLVVTDATGRLRELERIDFKNWTATPLRLVARLAQAVQIVAADVDAIVVMDAVGRHGEGVVSATVLLAVAEVARARPDLVVIADGQRGLTRYPPPIGLRVNAAEFAALTGQPPRHVAVAAFARERDASVYVTLGVGGIIGADRDGTIVDAPALPARGTTDPVGGGDAVTAALAAALSAGGSAGAEACAFAMLAASVVVHQVGAGRAASWDRMERLCAD
jgi:bifunctional ADP-heptose synthase (sugar kinase/adenylyltransferase)